jgi:centrosomal CEP192-like protein/ASPM-SPD-2-Hydin domain-containing protein
MGKTLLVYLLLVLFLTGSAFFAVPARAAINVSPTTVYFGNVTVDTKSAAQSMVITNEGSHSREILGISSTASEFVVSAPAMPMTLAAHASTSFHVMFLPVAVGNYTADIVVSMKNYNGETYSVSIPLHGTGKTVSTASTYLLSRSASSLTFANTLVGTSASQSVTLTNSGTGALTISQATVSGTGFTLSGFSGSVSLAAGQSLALTVNFAPTAVGSVIGSLTVVSNASNSPATIALSGTAVQPQISVTPSSVSFSDVSVGVTNTQAITIKNTGTGTLTISQDSLPGTTFTLSGLTMPLSLAPGATSSFTVNFTPASSSSFYANLSLTNNSPTSPVVVPLSGTSVASVLQLSASPTSLSFGSITTGTSSTSTVTVTNTGNTNVTISNIAASGSGFSSSGFSLPITLAAHQATSFSVIFDPTSAGSLLGTAKVTSNASNSPLVIALAGTGVATASHSVLLSWTPGSSSAVGFNLYRSSQASGSYAKLNSSELSSTSYTDTNVTAGQTYYYVATDLDSSGNESAYSNQVTAAIP